MNISKLSKIALTSTAAIALAALPMSAFAQTSPGSGTTTAPDGTVVPGSGTTTAPDGTGSMSSPSTTDSSMSNVNREDNNSDWGWLGLLGLAGLAGLRRPKHETVDHRYEPTTASTRSEIR